MHVSKVSRRNVANALRVCTAYVWEHAFLAGSQIDDPHAIPFPSLVPRRPSLSSADRTAGRLTQLSPVCGPSNSEVTTSYISPLYI